MASRGVPKSTRRPSTSTAPESGRKRPVTILISVDLPAPFSPTSAWTSPPLRSSDTPSSARTPGNDLVTESTTRFTSGRPAVDGAPAVQPDRGEDQRAKHELDPVGIDLREHHAILDKPDKQDREHRAENRDVAAGQRGAAYDRRGEGEKQPVRADGRLGRSELRDGKHRGKGGDESGKHMGGHDH